MPSRSITQLPSRDSRSDQVYPHSERDRIDSYRSSRDLEAKRYSEAFSEDFRNLPDERERFVRNLDEEESYARGNEYYDANDEIFESRRRSGRYSDEEPTRGPRDREAVGPERRGPMERGASRERRPASRPDSNADVTQYMSALAEQSDWLEKQKEEIETWLVSSKKIFIFFVYFLSRALA